MRAWGGVLRAQAGAVCECVSWPSAACVSVSLGLRRVLAYVPSVVLCFSDCFCAAFVAVLFSCTARARADKLAMCRPAADRVYMRLHTGPWTPPIDVGKSGQSGVLELSAHGGESSDVLEVVVNVKRAPPPFADSMLVNVNPRCARIRLCISRTGRPLHMREPVRPGRRYTLVNECAYDVRVGQARGCAHCQQRAACVLYASPWHVQLLIGFVCFFVGLLVSLFVCLFVCLFVSLIVCLFV